MLRGARGVVAAGWMLALAAGAIDVPSSNAATTTSQDWPARVLITNDDGIASPGLVELAKAFAEVAEVYVVAPSQNRSSSTHYCPLLANRRIQVSPMDMGEGITAYSVDGFPADCVRLALNGLLGDVRSDLMLSGINTAPDLGDSWVDSGTVGSVRVAAMAGLPAIALSGGYDARNPALSADRLAEINSWIVRLAQSEIVRGLSDRQFLAVNFPAPTTEIQGVRVVRSSNLHFTAPYSRSADRPTDDAVQLWVAGAGAFDIIDASGTDAEAFRAGFIGVIPMRADEGDPSLSEALGAEGGLPAWDQSQ